ncbi:uncharacterized protein LOC109859531 [Pseudomyrmex gracilis]|uniref:uncharacterized protein LOC109859531 n=1 Tax=Pseudomyrmex gracilis TaxID=219809 RepID=UPI000995D457|nr:uncharacterized protein LOC109859531 [Pseudomyrmex gracilis]
MSNTANLKYTCIADLVKKAKVNMAGKEPRSVNSRLPTMRQKSDDLRKEGDDENAYIMLQRWLETVEWIRKTTDYKNSKSVYSTNINTDQINEVENILAELKQKLEIRYECNSKKHNISGEKMEIDG